MDLEFNPGSDQDVPINPTIQANYELYTLIKTERLFSTIPDFSGFSNRLQAEADFSLYNWIANEALDRASLYDSIASTLNLALYPVYSAASTISPQAFTLWNGYRARYGKASIGHSRPWLPIGTVGPLLVMGHYLPHTKDTGGVPEGLAVQVLLTSEAYNELLSVCKERNDNYPPQYRPTPDVYSPLGEEVTTKEALEHLVQFAFIEAEIMERVKQAAEKGFLDEEDLPLGYYAAFRKLKENISVLSVSDISIPSDVAAAIPSAMCDLHKVIPFYVGHRNMYVGIADLLDYEFEDTFYNQVDLERKLIRFYCEPKDIQKALEMARSKGTADLKGLSKAAMDSVSFVEHTVIKLDDSILTEIPTQEKSIEHIVNRILFQGVMKRASDIHIEQYYDEVRIRYRMDGKLVNLQNIPIQLCRNVVTKIKILSALDIGEHRLPQDGRITMEIRGRLVDFRVAITPCKRDFEKVTIRIIDKANAVKGMSDLRLPVEQQDILNEVLTRDKGLILVTGPTGSGKSSTLYAMLGKLNTGAKNIHTIEDPIEQEIEGVNQTHIHPGIGLTFGEMLKRIMRVDPDVIMIGEIRDAETAEAAVQASLTGHLVLSTLHTNDAIRAISRMGHMGVEPYLLADSLLLMQAQRLVRVLCRCATSVPMTDDIKSTFEKYDIPIQNTKTIFSAGRCIECEQSGYRGRIAIMELVPVTEMLRDLISERASFSKLITEVRRDPNIFSMFQEGLKRVLQGVTTLEEIGPLRAAFS